MGTFSFKGFQIFYNLYIIIIFIINDNFYFKIFGGMSTEENLKYSFDICNTSYEGEDNEKCSKENLCILESVMKLSSNDSYYDNPDTSLNTQTNLPTSNNEHHQESEVVKDIFNQLVKTVQNFNEKDLNYKSEINSSMIQSNPKEHYTDNLANFKETNDASSGSLLSGIEKYSQSTQENVTKETKIDTCNSEAKPVLYLENGNNSLDNVNSHIESPFLHSIEEQTKVTKYLKKNIIDSQQINLQSEKTEIDLKESLLNYDSTLKGSETSSLGDKNLSNIVEKSQSSILIHNESTKQPFLKYNDGEIVENVQNQNKIKNSKMVMNEINSNNDLQFNNKKLIKSLERKSDNFESQNNTNTILNSLNGKTILKDVEAENNECKNFSKTLPSKEHGSNLENYNIESFNNDKTCADGSNEGKNLSDFNDDFICFKERQRNEKDSFRKEQENVNTALKNNEEIHDSHVHKKESNTISCTKESTLEFHLKNKEYLSTKYSDHKPLKENLKIFEKSLIDKSGENEALLIQDTNEKQIKNDSKENDNNTLNKNKSVDQEKYLVYVKKDLLTTPNEHLQTKEEQNKGTAFINKIHGKNEDKGFLGFPSQRKRKKLENEEGEAKNKSTKRSKGTSEPNSDLATNTLEEMFNDDNSSHSIIIGETFTINEEQMKELENTSDSDTKTLKTSSVSSI